MDKPACYNRPKSLDTRLVQDGWRLTWQDNTVSRTPIMKLIEDNMSKGCKQFGELGEARLRGWDCAGCRWKEASDV